MKLIRTFHNQRCQSSIVRPLGFDHQRYQSYASKVSIVISCFEDVGGGGGDCGCKEVREDEGYQMKVSCMEVR